MDANWVMRFALEMAENGWGIDAVGAWMISVEFWKVDSSELENRSSAGVVLYCSEKWGKWRESRRETRSDALTPAFISLGYWEY